jgi:hypothetical protein
MNGIATQSPRGEGIDAQVEAVHRDLIQASAIALQEQIN